MNQISRKLYDEVATRDDSGLDLEFCFDGKLGDFLRQSLWEDVAVAKFSGAIRAYYAIRGMLPLRFRHAVQSVRNRRLRVSPRWYVPQKLESFLLSSDQHIESFWPNQAECALVLTHDVEEQIGFDYVLDVAKVEEKLGLRSSWNIVPHKYRVDHGVLQELRARGHEIAVHGYNHDGKLFSSKSVFESRLDPIHQAMKEFQSVGFRSPMVHRNLRWMQSLHVEYDASCFDVDPYQAMPGGVEGIWPFRVGRFVELPYTLPQDHTLFVTLKEPTIRIWQDKLNFLRKYHGMALMLTHADYLCMGNTLGLYESFLNEALSTTRCWHVLPKEIAEWYNNQSNDRSRSGKSS